MAESRGFSRHTTRLGSKQIATWSDFFRPENSNGQKLARRAAPSYMISQPEDATYQVAEIGCGPGMDTYSLAVAFIMYGVRAHITATDVNPEVLAQAEQPYRQTRKQLQEKIARWRLPLVALDLFEVVDAQHIQPTQQLKDTVTFRRADIRTEPLAPEYNAVVAHNVLSYYAEGRKAHLDQVIGNIASGLQPEGLLTVNSYFPNFQPEFSEHGLVSVVRLCDNLAAPTFFEVR